ncbi:MAG: indole-3-glycerol phosphate synthase TrpC [Acidobacteria bacterium]|nr:MAG: indole-3-glycerol phosphate synthase TrpC [Acidobacteriota bacterium]
MNASPDLLSAIVASVHRQVEVRQAAEPLSILERRAQARSPRGKAFGAALAAPAQPNVIAECKRRSPSRGVLRVQYDPAAIAAGYEAAGAAAISVLTEPTFFDGSLDHLSAVRAAVSLPVLRKDFVVDEYQLFEARAAGADAVLLIVAALGAGALRRLARQAADLGLAALVEVHDEHELETALEAGAALVGVNTRDLRTLHVDPAVATRLIARIPGAVTAVAESGLRDAGEIHGLHASGYRAFLVGERLMTARVPGEALAALIGARA